MLPNADRHLRSHRKIGECEQSTRPEAYSEIYPPFDQRTCTKQSDAGYREKHSSVKAELNLGK